MWVFEFTPLPNMYFLRIWGCESHVKKLMSDKLAPKTEKCLFVGYPEETKGYYFYNPTENKVFVAQKTIFLERSSFPRRTVGVRYILKKFKSHKFL